MPTITVDHTPENPDLAANRVPSWWFFLIFLTVALSLGAVFRFDKTAQSNSVGLCLVSYSVLLASPRLLLNEGVARSIFGIARCLRGLAPSGLRRTRAIQVAGIVLSGFGLIGIITMIAGLIAAKPWAAAIGALVLTIVFAAATVVWLVDLAAQVLGTLELEERQLTRLRDLAIANGRAEWLWVLASIAFIVGTGLQLHSAIST